MTMNRGLRLPSAIRERKLSPAQEQFVHELYKAKEKIVKYPDLFEAIFDEAEPFDRVRVLRLGHATKRCIQGTGWHIEAKPGYGYQMRWLARDAPEDDPETVELLRDTGADIRAIRADFAMFTEQMRQIMGEIVTVPAHMLLPQSTWSGSLDTEILLTKGITGKLALIATREDVPVEAVTSRYRALKSAG